MTTDAPATDDVPDPRRPLRVDVLRRRLLVPTGPVDRLEVTDRTGSTNTDLADAVRAGGEGWDGVTVLVTEHQVDGRGRSGRAWQTPAAAALTFSVALRPTAPTATWGWLPLLVGLAAVTALRSTSGVPATLKWPNDLMVDVPGAPDLDGWGTQRKLGGILVELARGAAGPVAVAGVGINVSQTAAELPVPTARSLRGAGARDLDREALLVTLLESLGAVCRRWQDAAGDAGRAGLAEEVAAACSTLGRPVRVELPGGGVLAGTATGLGQDGALLLRDAGGATHAVRAGDVRHVREAR
ncbi:biotin--[acetyl-CoA-carboxylase] ligase [uncultured Cellulomonas sp.]|uniref:biotin--[acetyl-CoA-carboxylase] ligase n=1 Tax=uncultured Cellulomonas sp. TaxID=189682 RepID=UPI002622527D|nr:biotin--[acetyl-CoA-carboxylase] ligase [uncultured Cellulomonas sp.]